MSPVFGGDGHSMMLDSTCHGLHSVTVSTRPLHVNASCKANQHRSTFMRHKLPLSDSSFEHTRLHVIQLAFGVTNIRGEKN